MASANPPKSISSLHKQIMRAELAGVRPQELASRFNLTESWLSVVRNSELYRREMERLQESTDDKTSDRVADSATNSPVQKVLDGAGVGAAQKVVDLMEEADSEKVQQTSAFDILDRLGFGKNDTKIVQNTTIISDRAASALGEALRESREFEVNRE